MKCIIAGSRTILDYEEVKQAFEDCPFKDQITEIVSGCAKGVDSLGERLAFEKDIPLARFPADWKRLGPKAGPIRNTQMGDYADCAIIVVPQEWTSGSAHMHSYMVTLKKPVFVRHTKGA